jgi:hypothetical protein
MVVIAESQAVPGGAVGGGVELGGHGPYPVGVGEALRRLDRHDDDVRAQDARAPEDFLDLVAEGVAMGGVRRETGVVQVAAQCLGVGDRVERLDEGVAVGRQGGQGAFPVGGELFANGVELDGQGRVAHGLLRG